MASKSSRRSPRTARPAQPPPVQSEASRWTGLSIWLAALTTAGIVFSPAINGTFIFDDFHLPFTDPNAAAMPARFWIGNVRPLLMATYWANHLISGTQTFWYHLVNIFLHAAAAVLVYFVVRKLLEISGSAATKAPASASPAKLHWIALFGAGLFLLHPLQTESVDYIAGRSEVLCALFVLSAWLLFLNRFNENTTPARAAAIILCGAAAVLSKESGVCLAALIVASDLYFRNGSLSAQVRKRIFLYVPGLIGLLAATIAILRALAHSTTAGFASGATPFEYAITQCRAIAIYLRLFLIPAGQNVDWQLPFSHSLLDVHVWPYVFVLAVLIAAIVWFYNRARLVSFGLLAFLLALAPTSSFIPVQDALAERRMYLPIVGLSIALAGAAAIGLSKALLNARLIAILASAALLLLAVISYNRSGVWSSDTLLWEDAIAKNPGNARALSNLGGAMMLRHDCAGAAREYKLIVDMHGMDEINGRNLGSAYECSQQTDLALSAYRSLVALHPTAEIYVRIGFLEGIRNNADASLAAFEKALQLDPNNAPAYAFRGVARATLNDVPEAREDFRRALAIDPGNPVASTWVAKLAKLPPDR
jgi:protein O-mannosyl-transferase